MLLISPALHTVEIITLGFSHYTEGSPFGEFVILVAVSATA
jgi:hypothetical protein